MTLHNPLCPSCWAEGRTTLLDVDFGDDHEAGVPGLSCKWAHFFNDWEQVAAAWAQHRKTPPTIRYEYAEYQAS